MDKNKKEKEDILDLEKVTKKKVATKESDEDDDKSNNGKKTDDDEDLDLVDVKESDEDDDKEEDDESTESKDAKKKSIKKKTVDKKEMKEAVDKIFSDMDGLSEDFKFKASTIIESLVNTRASEIEESLSEEIESNLMESVDEYLKYVTKEWMQENEIALQSSIKTEIAEEFIVDMKSLLESHNITISDENCDLYESSKNENVKLQTQLDSLLEEASAQNTQLFESEKELSLIKLTEDLTIIQEEQLLELVESIDSDDIDTFNKKVTIIKEAHFKTKNKNKKSEDCDDNDKSDAEADEDDNNDDMKTESLMSRYINSALRN